MASLIRNQRLLRLPNTKLMSHFVSHPEAGCNIRWLWRFLLCSTNYLFFKISYMVRWFLSHFSHLFLWNNTIILDVIQKSVLVYTVLQSNKVNLAWLINIIGQTLIRYMITTSTRDEISSRDSELGTGQVQSNGALIWLLFYSFIRIKIRKLSCTLLISNSSWIFCSPSYKVSYFHIMVICNADFKCHLSVFP